MTFWKKIATTAFAFTMASAAASAQTTELRIARSFGISYLPLIVAEKFGYVEESAKSLGVERLAVKWSMLSSSGIMYDMLISNQLDVIVGGGPSLVTLWSKTAGTPMEVKGVGALTTQAQVLMTINPNIKSIADFTSKDRIAVNTVKSSSAAMTLQVAAAKQWGDKQYEKLDELTVSMPHPEAYTALASGRSEITSHVTNDPYLFYERKLPGARRILSSFELFGRHSNGIFLTTKAFYGKDPRLTKAFIDGVDKANRFIVANPKEAAEIYIAATNDKLASVDELIQMMNDPEFAYETTPRNVMNWAKFMEATGRIKKAPGDWKELFFDVMHDRDGS